MSNQTFNMNPYNVHAQIGAYKIDGIAAKTDAIVFNTTEQVSDLVQGQNVTTITWTANVSIGMDMKLNAGSPSNTVIDAFVKARLFSNTSLLPDDISLPASGLLNDIPFILTFYNGGIPTGVLSTKSWTITNAIDVSIPFASTTDFERQWNFKMTYEPQDLTGAFVTI